MEKRNVESEPDSVAPVVAIVGRPNVGKSALFNRLAGRRIAIVHDQPGVTRDRIVTELFGPDGLRCSLIDTGGIGAALDDTFANQVEAEADIAVATAGLILFVVDGRQGLTPIDQVIADKVRRSGKPVVLVINKLDDPKHDPQAAEFAALGFSEVVPISVEHNRGCDALKHRLLDLSRDLPVPPAQPDAGKASTPIKIAILGRPNVGKSSLLNAIIKEARTLVSDVAGTTRDAVDVPYRYGDRHYLLIDTAGIRRRTRVSDSVEAFSVMRSERSIRRADLCVLLIDASQGVTEQDRRIARSILDEHKPCVIALNKFDLFQPDGFFYERLEALKERVRSDLFFVPYAPVVAVSALEHKFIGKLFQAVDKVRRASRRNINTGQLNRLIGEAVERNPPPMKRRRRFKILYATQIPEDRPRLIPAPDYLLFVNSPGLVSDPYLRYLEARIREREPYPGLPIRFQLRGREPRKASPGSAESRDDGREIRRKKVARRRSGGRFGKGDRGNAGGGGKS